LNILIINEQVSSNNIKQCFTYKRATQKSSCSGCYPTISTNLSVHRVGHHSTRTRRMGIDEWSWSISWGVAWTVGPL